VRKRERERERERASEREREFVRPSKAVCVSNVRGRERRESDRGREGER